jgi:hypothetical protein
MTYLLAFAMFMGSAIVAVLGLLAARKWLNLERLRSHHEVSGYLIAVGGTLYAVLLGLIVVDAMGQGQKARGLVERETNSIADVYILSANLPSPKRDKVRTLCKEYADQVLSTEWQQMSCGSYCTVSQGLALGLMTELMNFEPRSENDKALYPKMVEEASDFWQNRQARIKEAERGIPTLELIALLLGAVLMIVWTYLFGSEHFALQVSMTAMIAMLISLNFILLFLFAYPFRGDFSIKSDSFTTLQAVFRQTKNAPKTAVPAP